ncbi:MaoC family dehydratase [Rhodobacter capsulatus]|uniref:MaoC family dehydratase n=1 Tax=Rhodobacter capsulatus TaxID=1061 RepID=UPI004027DD6E
MRNAYLEDLSVGQRFGSGTVRVSAEDIVRFAQDFDPQPFHLDPALAGQTLFGGLAASGWHTAALTMRLLVDGEFVPAGGFIGAGFDELAWPVPVRPGDELHVTSEILALRRSQSRPMQGVIKVRNLTINQNGETVQRAVGNLIVQARSA